MDKTLLKNRFAKAAHTYQANALAQERISLRMIELLKEHTHGVFPRIYEFGCGTGFYSRQLERTFAPEQLILNDLCQEMQCSCQEWIADNKKIRFTVGDAENMTLPTQLNLLTSCSTMQWFHAPIDFLKRSQSALVENGIVAISTFGTNNLKEIYALTKTGLTYLSKEEWVENLGEAYQIVHAEEEEFSLPFRQPIDVLYHLKRTGVNGIANHRFTKPTLQQFIRDYEAFKTTDGSYRLTYHPIYLVLRKK